MLLATLLVYGSVSANIAGAHTLYTYISAPFGNCASTVSILVSLYWHFSSRPSRIASRNRSVSMRLYQSVSPQWGTILDRQTCGSCYHKHFPTPSEADSKSMGLYFFMGCAAKTLQSSSFTAGAFKRYVFSCPFLGVRATQSCICALLVLCFASYWLLWVIANRRNTFASRSRHLFWHTRRKTRCHYCNWPSKNPTRARSHAGVHHYRTWNGLLATMAYQRSFPIHLSLAVVAFGFLSNFSVCSYSPFTSKIAYHAWLLATRRCVALSHSGLRHGKVTVFRTLAFAHKSTSIPSGGYVIDVLATAFGFRTKRHLCYHSGRGGAMEKQSASRLARSLFKGATMEREYETSHPLKSKTFPVVDIDLAFSTLTMMCSHEIKGFPLRDIFGADTTIVKKLADSKAKEPARFVTAKFARVVWAIHELYETAIEFEISPPVCVPTKGITKLLPTQGPNPSNASGSALISSPCTPAMTIRAPGTPAPMIEKPDANTPPVTPRPNTMDKPSQPAMQVPPRVDLPITQHTHAGSPDSQESNATPCRRVGSQHIAASVVPPTIFDPWDYNTWSFAGLDRSQCVRGCAVILHFGKKFSAFRMLLTFLNTFVLIFSWIPVVFSILFSLMIGSSVIYLVWNPALIIKGLFILLRAVPSYFEWAAEQILNQIYIELQNTFGISWPSSTNAPTSPKQLSASRGSELFSMVNFTDANSSQLFALLADMQAGQMVLQDKLEKQTTGGLFDFGTFFITCSGMCVALLARRVM